MDHAAYQTKLKTKSFAELLFIIKDAQAAMAANPENPKNSYYADEVCYAGMEIRRRQV
jgi:hypothetical protein